MGVGHDSRLALTRSTQSYVKYLNSFVGCVAIANWAESREAFAVGRGGGVDSFDTSCRCKKPVVGYVSEEDEDLGDFEQWRARRHYIYSHAIPCFSYVALDLVGVSNPAAPVVSCPQRTFAKRGARLNPREIRESPLIVCTLR